jgi:hypothetical protein
MMSATRKDGAPWEETTSVNSPPAVLPVEGKGFPLVAACNGRRLHGDDRSVRAI